MYCSLNDEVKSSMLLGQRRRLKTLAF